MGRDWKVADRPRVIRSDGRVEHDWTIINILKRDGEEDRIRLVKDGFTIEKCPRRSTLDGWQR